MTAAGKWRALVAAIGNPDRGDDGVGPAVASRLRGRVPVGVRILETGGDVLALIDAWDAFRSVIVVDAAAPIDRPGRIHRLDLASRPLPGRFAAASTHAFGLGEAVELARNLGRLPSRLVVYLIEGERFDIGGPLSLPVAAAIDQVADRILEELAGRAPRHAAEGPADHA